MDPQTGAVTEYRVPRVPADTDVGFAHPGTHGIWVDKDGIVWMTEQIWDQPENNFTGLDPRTGEFTQRKGFGCAVGPDGSVWTIRAGSVTKARHSDR
jgi:streptogramin lyase